MTSVPQRPFWIAVTGGRLTGKTWFAESLQCSIKGSVRGVFGLGCAANKRWACSPFLNVGGTAEEFRRLAIAYRLWIICALRELKESLNGGCTYLVTDGSPTHLIAYGTALGLSTDFIGKVYEWVVSDGYEPQIVVHTGFRDPGGTIGTWYESDRVADWYIRGRVEDTEGYDESKIYDAEEGKPPPSDRLWNDFEKRICFYYEGRSASAQIRPASICSGFEDGFMALVTDPIISEHVTYRMTPDQLHEKGCAFYYNVRHNHAMYDQGYGCTLMLDNVDKKFMLQKRDALTLSYDNRMNERPQMDVDEETVKKLFNKSPATWTIKELEFGINFLKSFC
jgi:hypothetical protein